ncbi:MAG: dihydroneopterin aldolase [Actinomycetota bacterium]
MTDSIRISRIHGFGYHGVFEAEQLNGQDFYVDLVLTLDLSKPSQSDDLSDTVDYSVATQIVVDLVENKKFLLIEKLAGSIAENLLATFSSLEEVEVTVHKPQAPVSAKVEDISVVLVRRR